jgi:PAS domain S-box-containing protein
VSRIEHMGEDNLQQVSENDFLAGGGELGELIRLHDWSATPLGPRSAWPQSLRSVVSLCVKSRFPIIIQWGWPELTVLYNDAYVPVISDAHPRALGRPLFESWPELRTTIAEMLESVLNSSNAVLSEDLLHLYHRGGYLEETYFNVSFNPIVLESGKIGGSFTLMENTTDRVIGERRLRTLRDLAARTVNANGIEEACRIAGDVLAENRHDLPFALLYLVNEDRKRARLVASVGLNPGETASPHTVDLTEPETGAAWPVARVANTNSVQQVDDLEKFGPLPGGPWNDSPRCALALSIIPDGHQLPAAVLVVGISPRRALDDAYHGFLNSIANQIAATIMRVMANESLAIRQIVDLIPQMIAVMKPDGTQLYTNKFVLDYTGFTLEETLGGNIRSRGIHPADARVTGERHKGFLGATPFTVEQRIRRKDGQYRWFLSHFNPLLDDQGRVIRWYSTGTDIDDRVRAEGQATKIWLCESKSSVIRCLRTSLAPPNLCVEFFLRSARWRLQIRQF